MYEKSRIESLYLQACEDFFPEWRNAGNWKIVYCPDDRPGDDFPFPCCVWAEPVPRNFYVYDLSRVSAEWVTADLLYLICYAKICDTAKCAHGPEWGNLMLRAAYRADETGRDFLARLLRVRVTMAQLELERSRQCWRKAAGRIISPQEEQALDAQLRVAEDEYDKLLFESP